MSNKIPKIFLSYSWANSESASILQKDFEKIGIPLIKDTLNLKYKDSIGKYMLKIRDSDFAILLISKEYLESINCMYEALEILKEQNHTEKILPILIGGTKIFNATDRVKFIKYWKHKKETLEHELKGIDITSAIEAYNDLKSISNIYSSIDSFLKKISDLKTLTLDELKKENYKSILDYLGFEDVTFLYDLLIITQINNLNLQEIAIEKHFEKFGSSHFALSTKAQIKGNLGKNEEAKTLYQKSLSINPESSSTLNNYGFLLDSKFNKPKKAVEYYKKAISINTNLIEARINLATAYRKLEKVEKSKKEYFKILKIFPKDSDAHNNLANLYREAKNQEKALYHFERAIEYSPNNVNALINLGNYYDVQLNNFEKGKIYYERAKKIANHKNVDYLIDMMFRMKEKRDKKQ